MGHGGLLPDRHGRLRALKARSDAATGLVDDMRDWCIKSQAWLEQVLNLLGEFAKG